MLMMLSCSYDMCTTLDSEGMAELETTDWKYLRTFRLIASTVTDGISFTDLAYRSSRSSNGECDSIPPVSLSPPPVNSPGRLTHPAPLWTLNTPPELTTS